MNVLTLLRSPSFGVVAYKASSTWHCEAFLAYSEKAWLSFFLLSFLFFWVLAKTKHAFLDNLDFLILSLKISLLSSADCVVHICLLTSFAVHTDFLGPLVKTYNLFLH